MTDPNGTGLAGKENLPGQRGLDLDDPSFLARFKELRLTSFAVGHRTSVLMLLAILILAGFTAYRTIPRESSPEIVIPIFVVQTLYPGVSPADMETLVTRPLEDELNTISEVRELRSTSTEGVSSITVEFSTAIDLNPALQKVREKVDLARPNLPSDAEEPQIIEFNLSEFPIMQVNLSGEYGLVRLKEVAELVQDRLEQIPMVLRVDLWGALEREVQVDVDLPRLKYYGLAINDVVDAVRNENVNIPGGSIDVGVERYLVRVDGEFVDPSVIEDLVVSIPEGRAVYVRDLARVSFGFAERETYARLNGHPVVTLDVVKRAGENIIAAAEEVKSAIEQLRPHFPPTTRVVITSDQSREIRSMVASLENNIISGLILIMTVLLFFLKLRNSFFVAISIPLSMLLSFIILALLGITLNMVVLFSLILALGMLVDNAIVVVENIYRYLEEGWSPSLAARKATGEVAPPVIVATLTTLAAFAPLLFWPDIVGEFMKFLPMTLIITLSSSLFVALVIVPTLCAMFMRLDSDGSLPLTRAAAWTLRIAAALVLVFTGLAHLLAAVLLVVIAAGLNLLHRYVLVRAGRVFQDRALPANIRFYSRRLRWALEHRLLVLGVTGFVFVLTLLLFARFNRGIEFFPENIPPAQTWISVEAPVGTRAEETDRVVRLLEEEIASVPGRRDVESVVATVGGGASLFRGGPSQPHQGRVTLNFVDFEDRIEDSFATAAHLQETLGREIAGAEISVDLPVMGPPTGPPVNIEVAGQDPGLLKELSDRILQILRRDAVYRKLVGLESDMDEARAELQVRVDREKAWLHGLSTSEVGWAVRGAVQGVEAAKYRTGNDEFDIVVRLAAEYREDLSALNDLVVAADGGVQIPLSSVARWEIGRGLGSIQRKDMDRMVTISADVRSGLNRNAVINEVRGVLAPFVADELPIGYTLRFTGQIEDQTEAEEFLSFAFLAAILLIAFILASRFNSVLKPFIILTSVIISTIGVLLGLMLFQMPFVIIMTGVGIISLAGIVVNNAIVLIDYIDILRRRDGLSLQEALIQGGMTRFRPVVLTAVTTALGLVPLAVGLNFDFLGLFTALAPDLYWGGEQAAWWGPMAVAVIVGILFATFLTLMVVPVMYSLVDDGVAFLRHYYLAAPDPPDGGGPEG